MDSSVTAPIPISWSTLLQAERMATTTSSSHTETMQMLTTETSYCTRAKSAAEITGSSCLVQW